MRRHRYRRPPLTSEQFWRDHGMMVGHAIQAVLATIGLFFLGLGLSAASVLDVNRMFACGAVGFVCTALILVFQTSIHREEERRYDRSWRRLENRVYPTDRWAVLPDEASTAGHERDAQRHDRRDGLDGHWP